MGAPAVTVRADAAGATAAGFADTTAGIHLWAPMFMTGGRFHSTDEAVAAARRFDVIAALPHQLGEYLPAMRAANPGLRVYVYVNGSYLHESQLGDLPSWVLARTTAGDLIRSNQWGNFLGTPSMQRWITYKQHECADALTASDADGCYLDMLGIAPTVPGYGTGLPVNPATGLLWTRSEWLTATSALGAQIAQYTGRPVLSNGFGNGRRYFSGAGPTKILLSGTSGSTSEAFMKKPRGAIDSYESVAHWPQEADMLADANLSGGVALTVTKTWGGGTAEQKAAWRLYSLATFLLGNGGHSYYDFLGDPSQPATLDAPLFHLRIGLPLGPYSAVGGAYQRWFSLGRVVVNPGSQPVSLALGTGYRTSAGVVVNSITLAPHTAEILTQP
jgi:hypothetical protein